MASGLVAGTSFVLPSEHLELQYCIIFPNLENVSCEETLVDRIITLNNGRLKTGLDSCGFSPFKA